MEQTQVSTAKRRRSTVTADGFQPTRHIVQVPEPHGPLIGAGRTQPQETGPPVITPDPAQPNRDTQVRLVDWESSTCGD